MANNRSATCVMTETTLEIQNNFKSPVFCAKSLHGGSSGEQGNMCYFPPPSSAVCFSHVAADTMSAVGLCMICRGAHPKEETQGKQGDPSLGTEGMRGKGALWSMGEGKQKHWGCRVGARLEGA